MSMQIQFRRDLAAEWVSLNPVLAQGEMGLEIDTLKTKLGDGITAWTSLAYWGSGSGGVTSVTAGDSSVVVGGTSSAPTVRTGTLDVIASDNPPAADWSNNSHKITSLTAGVASTDAANLGQTVPVMYKQTSAAATPNAAQNVFGASVTLGPAGGHSGFIPVGIYVTAAGIAVPAAGTTPGQFLATPVSYAPASQTLLSTPAAATVASGSNGGTISGIASWSSPSAGVLAVASTAGYPSSGTLAVAASGATTALVTYTGTSGGNSFTGCAYVSGSASGTVATGGAVSLASMAPFSSTNVNTGNFTAPQSGQVLVTASFVGSFSASGAEAAFGLAAHGTLTPVIGNIVEFRDDAAAVNRAYTVRFAVTGLTPGTSYNFDLLGCALSGGTFSICAYGQSAAVPGGGTLSTSNEGAAVVMTVQSAGAGVTAETVTYQLTPTFSNGAGTAHTATATANSAVLINTALFAAMYQAGGYLESIAFSCESSIASSAASLTLSAFGFNAN